MSGFNMTTNSPAVNNAASFTFPVAELKHQGNYSCLYQVTLSGRTVDSAESAPITVVVKQSLLLLICAVFGGTLLLLLFVYFLVYLVNRRRKQPKQPAVLFQTQRFTREDRGICEAEADEGKGNHYGDETNLYEECSPPSFKECMSAKSEKQTKEKEEENKETSDDENYCNIVTLPVQ
ncbi:uncharacterized protein LOC105353568 [Oryzias latipes]